MAEFNNIPLGSYIQYSEEEMKKRAEDFRREMQRRRTVRHFSNQPVPREVIEDCILTAGSAPSGANRQPWHFIVVTNSDLKRQIHQLAEKEEYKFYQKDAGDEWLMALKPLGTNFKKPFLEVAPYLIVVFAESYSISPNGQKEKNYYVRESVGIATGMLITAIHQAGLTVLTYTPSRMSFLNKILDRGKNERPFIVLVIGYPAEGTLVPEISKKTLNEIATFK
jgi:iodotyrosine deiodinase